MNGEAVREIVLPGDLLCEKAGRKAGNGVYVEGEKIFAKVLGIPKIEENEVSVIPLAGVYIPRTGDRVIGKIVSVEISGWFVDINSPYFAFLPLSEAVVEFVDIYRIDISRYFDVDEIIFCTVSKVTKDKTVQVSMKNIGSRKLHGGVLIKINPNKVPRIIGKGGSMINIIKRKTGCEIYVGRNGYIWIKGERKAKAVEAILKVEKESHIIGLTEKIERMLSE